MDNSRPEESECNSRLSVGANFRNFLREKKFMECLGKV